MGNSLLNYHPSVTDASKLKINNPHQFVHTQTSHKAEIPIFNLVIFGHIAEYLNENELCNLSFLNHYFHKYVDHVLWKVRYLRIVCRIREASVQNCIIENSISSFTNDITQNGSKSLENFEKNSHKLELPKFNESRNESNPNQQNTKTSRIGLVNQSNGSSVEFEFPFSIPLSQESFFIDYKRETMTFLYVEKKISNLLDPTTESKDSQLAYLDIQTDSQSVEEIEDESWEDQSIDNENNILEVRQRQLDDQSISDNDSWSDSQEDINSKNSEIATSLEISKNKKIISSNLVIGKQIENLEFIESQFSNNEIIEEKKDISVYHSDVSSKEDDEIRSTKRVYLELPLDTPSDAETPTNSDIVSDEEWDASSPKQELQINKTINFNEGDNDKKHIYASKQESLSSKNNLISDDVKYKIVLMLFNVNILKETYLHQDFLATIKVLKDLNLNHKIGNDITQNTMFLEGIKVKVIFFQCPNISVSPIISSFRIQTSQISNVSLSNSKYQDINNIISGIIIGPFLLYYDENSKLVIPKKLIGEALIMANQLVSIAEIFHLSFADVKNIIAMTVIEFNRSLTGVINEKKANCQVFVDNILHALGLDKTINLDKCGLAFSNTIKDLRETGRSDATYTINHDDSTYSTCTRFKSHNQLDTFVNHLLNEQPTFPIENVFDFSLLKCFDNLFEDSNSFDESKENCPFSIAIEL